MLISDIKPYERNARHNDKAVNLGDDTDTTAAVAGGLAGIVYGIDSIPAEWLAKLRGKDVIDACLFA